jgi:hypothetical protein
MCFEIKSNILHIEIYNDSKQNIPKNKWYRNNSGKEYFLKDKIFRAV